MYHFLKCYFTYLSHIIYHVTDAMSAMTDDNSSTGWCVFGKRFKDMHILFCSFLELQC